MQTILPAHGIELQIVESKQAQGGVIGASKVRELVGLNDLRVPPTRLIYLQSDEAVATRERLQGDYQNK